MDQVGTSNGGEDCALTYCARLLHWAAEWQIREYQHGGIRMHPSLKPSTSCTDHPHRHLSTYTKLGRAAPHCPLLHAGRELP